MTDIMQTLEPSVCIIRHQTYSFKCYSMYVSLPAMSLGDWFCMSRKGRTEGGGLVHPKVENSMAVKIPQQGHFSYFKHKWTQKTGHYIQWTWGPGTQGSGTQGPKVACTVHVRTVASSLSEYPGPRMFCVWVCVSKRLNHFSIPVPQLCHVAIYLVTHSQPALSCIGSVFMYPSQSLRVQRSRAYSVNTVRSECKGTKAARKKVPSTVHKIS